MVHAIANDLEGRISWTIGALVDLDHGGKVRTRRDDAKAIQRPVGLPDTDETRYGDERAK